MKICCNFEVKIMKSENNETVILSGNFKKDVDLWGHFKTPRLDV